MGFPTERNKKIAGAHKNGATISGRRVAGRKITDMRLFLNLKISRFLEGTDSDIVGELGEELEKSEVNYQQCANQACILKARF